MMRKQGSTARLVVVRLVDAPGDDAAHKHRAAARGCAGAGVHGAAAGERAHRGAGRAEATGGDTRGEDAAGGRAALEAHHLVAVGAAGPCARSAALASSNRGTSRAVLCTRNIASTSGAGGGAAALETDAPHPDEKMSSTTCRDKCPSGSSAIVRNAELTGTVVAGDAMNAAATICFGFFLGLGLAASCHRSCSPPLRLSRRGICFLPACRTCSTESLTSAAA